MITRGFVDLLFILLCSTIVLLAQSIRLNGLAAEPARVGSGGSRILNDERLVLVSVHESFLLTENGSFANVDALHDQRFQGTLILVPADKSISHHRIMDVWREAEIRGLNVELGVEPQGV